MGLCFLAFRIQYSFEGATEQSPPGIMSGRSQNQRALACSADEGHLTEHGVTAGQREGPNSPTGPSSLQTDFSKPCPLERLHRFLRMGN